MNIPTTELSLHALDWRIKDGTGIDDPLNIHCWGLDQDSQPHLVRFIDFPAFCFIELPNFVNNESYTWTAAKAKRLIDDELAWRLKDHTPYHHQFLSLKKLYYFRADSLYPMIQLHFCTLEAMRHCANLLGKELKTREWGYLKIKPWEHDISLVRKLLTTQNLRYSQWFRVLAQEVDPSERISTLEREYIGRWDTLVAVSPEECKMWATYPGILAFDIECYSDNHRAMPDKYNSLHVAYMISCIYQRYKHPESRKRYGIIIGDCNEIPPEKLKNCVIIQVNNELEMVQAFGQVVDETDPDVLTGYNIILYDYPYLDHRIRRKLKKWPAMGRIAGEVSTIIRLFSANPEKTPMILDMEGRISIDLYPVIEGNYKFESYKLDSVCKHFLGKTKHDISPVEMFEIYEAKLQADQELSQGVQGAQEKYQRALANTTRVMEYCIQDSELVIDLMEKLNVWVTLVEMSSIVGVTIENVSIKGSSDKCSSQLYDVAAKMGYIMDSQPAGNDIVTGATVLTPITGFHENVLCLDFTSLYPSIMRAYNICYTTLIPPELDEEIPDDDCHVIERELEDDDSSSESSAEEGEAKKKKKKKKKSSQPSNKPKEIQRLRFYKHRKGLLPILVEALVNERREVKKQIAITQKEVELLEEKEERLRKLSSQDEIAQIQGDKHAFEEMRRILQINQAERLDIIEKSKASIMKMSKQELAIKVAANSLYGFLCIKTGGRLPLRKGGNAITAKGRQLLEEVQRYVKTTYQGTIIYGDTDSIMVKLPQIERADQCHYWGTRLAQEINGIAPGGTDCDGKLWPQGRKGLFPPPLAMEFEKPMDMLSLMKKKYAYIIKDKNGNLVLETILDKDGKVVGKQPKIEKKGIVTARRNTCLVGETLISLGNGTSRPLSSLVTSGQMVYGWDGRGLTRGRQTAFMDQGVRRCLEITTIDQKSITCTADHKFLVKQGDGTIVWKEAQQLDRTTDLLVKSLENPSDLLDEPMNDWFIPLGGEIFDFSVEKRPATLALMRILGHICGDIGQFNESEMRMETQHYLDLPSALKDIALVSSQQEIRVTQSPSRHHNLITLPSDLQKKLCNLWPGYRITFPPFLFEDECPLSVIQEFCGGLLGHQGRAPWITSMGQIHYGTSIFGSLNEIQINKVWLLLSRLGYSRPSSDSDYFPILEGIGYRYALRKQVAQTAASFLHRTVLTSLDLKAIGVLDFFDLQTETLPVMYVPIKEVRYGGYHQVYDLSVETLESFVANGYVVHNCAIFGKMYTEILRIGMLEKLYLKAMDVLIDTVYDLISGEISHRDLIISQKLGSEYKLESAAMKIFATNLKKAGKPANPGDRLPFLVIKDPSKRLLGERMILVEDYEELLRNQEAPPIDYAYYLKHNIMNPTDQLISTLFRKDISRLTRYSYLPPSKRTFLDLTVPCKILLSFIENGLDIRTLKDIIRQEVTRTENRSPQIRIILIHLEEEGNDQEKVEEVDEPVEEEEKVEVNENKKIDLSKMIIPNLSTKDVKK